MKKIENVRKWIQYGVAPVLKKLAKAFVGSIYKMLNIRFEIGNDSYNYGNAVVVSVSEEEAETMPKEDLMRVLKFKMYHELSHALYTNDEQYEEAILLLANAINDYAESVFPKTGLLLLQGDLKAECSWLLNSIEDGRIENILCLSYPGAKKHRDWYRLLEWEAVDVAERGSNFWVDLKTSIHKIATMGVLPKGFSEKYPQGNIETDLVLSTIEPISDFVVANSIEGAYDSIKKIGEIIAPVFLAEYGLTEEEYNEKVKEAEAQGKPAYSKEELREIAEQVAKEAKNNGKAENFPGAPLPNNGPLVSVLQDGEEEQEESGEEGEKKPDLVVDLRKNPPKPKMAENEDEDNPYYYRPEDLPAPQENAENGQEGSESGEESENGENSEGEENSSGGNSSEGDDSKGEEVNKSPQTGTQKGKGASKGNSKESKNSKGEKGDGKPQKGKTNTLDTPKDAGDIEGYRLPDPQDFKNAIKQAMKDVLEDMEAETRADVSRANNEEASWEKSSIDDALPLKQERVSCLASEFGGYDVDVMDYRKKGGRGKCPPDILSKSKRLASNIKQIIQTKVIKDKKDAKVGIVDTQNLGKFITGQQDFYKQDGRKTKTEIACMILKDDSGSMHGRNEQKAVEVLAELEETFKILEFPLRIQAFSTMRGETMKVIKSWDDTDKAHSYTWSFHSCSEPNGGNNDAYSIALATDILAERKEKNKLLVIVSDGAPCCSTELVKKAVERARTMGIFVISILIGSEHDVEANWNIFVSMYGKNLLAGSLDNMGNQLFKFLKKFVADIR